MNFIFQFYISFGKMKTTTKTNTERKKQAKKK